MRRGGSLVGVVALVAGGAGLWWLMQHDLRLAAYALVAGLVALLVAAVWTWRGRHRRWTAVLLAVVVVSVGAVGFYGWRLNGKLADIPRADDTVLQQGTRPPEDTQALNLLLLGADNPDPREDKPTVAELLAADQWDAGAYRSDSMMLVHIPADRRSAVVVSIPRDSYVAIYDDAGDRRELNKINAAFSEYGPFGSLRTVENLTGLRIDHLAMIDFEGFRDLTTALGGVDVYVPESVYDSAQDQQWDQGWVHLEDALALKYVRMRHGLTNGDFDRVARQQNFLRALVSTLTDDGTVGNPITLDRTVSAIVKYLTVDASWSSGDIRDLALGLRKLSSDRIDFLTVALDHYESVDGVGSVNIIDRVRARQLWRAIAKDDVDGYLKRHPEDALGDPETVS
jgi:LCP family protein required for cell wall assembly